MKTCLRVFFAISFTLVRITASEAQQVQTKIGIIGPLSGEIAPWGEDVRKALQFANEKIGGKKFKLIFEDDQCLGKNAVTAAHKLISVDQIDFGMVVCTESMLASAPVFEKARVVVVSPITSGMNISAAGDYIFRTWPSDAGAAHLLYQYVSKRHKLFGLLSEERGFPQELTNSFLAAGKGGTLKIITENFHSGTSDFKALLLKIRGQGVEGLLVNTNSEQTFANVIKQLRELNWTVATYGVYIPGNKSFVELAGAAANEIVFVDAPSADLSLTPEGRVLYREFTSRFGPMQSASFVFPSTFEAFRLVKSLTVTDLEPRAFLYTGKFSGIFGPYSFDRNGDIVGIRHVLKIIRNGRAVVLNVAG